jgi:hypothetical protein
MPLYERGDTNSPFVIPSDHNLLGWSFDPANLQAGVLQLGGGTLQVVRFKVMNTTAVSNLIVNLTLGGAVLVSGRNLAGLYSDSGNLLGQTVDQTTAWSTAGLKVMALQSPATVTPWTWYKMGWFNNGLTAPSMSRGQNTDSAVLNAGMSGSTLRYSTADTGLTTTLPATIGTQTASAIAWWVGVS